MFNKFLNRSRTNQEEEKQGFICPECKRDFLSIDELSDHHVKEHPPADYHESFQADDGANSLVTNGESTAALIKQEISDLETSLQEESWFAADLQKELTLLQAENEALKSCVNSRSGNAQLDVVSRKAADLSVTVAQLSSELDEERSRTSVMGSSLVDLQKTNEELCESQMNLQTKLKQSTSNDDVEALKEQLAKCQVQMDSILEIGEKEVNLLKEHIDSAKIDKLKLEDKLTQNEATIEKIKDENKTLTGEVAHLQSSKEQSKMAQTMFDVQTAQHVTRISELEAICSRHTEDIKRKEDEKSALFDKMSGFNSTLNQLNSQIGKDDETMNTEMKQLAANFSDFQHTLHDKDAKNNELSAEISSLRTDISSSKAQCATLQTQLTLSQNNSDNITNKLLKLEEAIAEKDAALGESSVKLSDLKNSLQSSESQTCDLQEKLKSLELLQGTTNTEKNQLSEDNIHLNECIAQLGQSMSELKTQMEDTVKELDALYKEKCDESYQLDFKLTALRNEYSDVSLNSEKLKEAHAVLLSKEEALNVCVEELEVEIREYEISTKSKSDELSLMSTKLVAATTDKEQLEKSNSSLEGQLGVVSSCVMDLNSRIEKKDEMLLELNKKIHKMEAEAAKPCTMCLNYESKLNKSHMQIQDLEAERDGQRDRLVQLVADVAGYRHSEETTSEKLHVLEYDLEREQENAINTEALLVETRKHLLDSTNLLEGKVKMLENQLTDTNEKARIFEIANKELTLLKETLEEGLSETERTLKENSELHIKEMNDLNSKNSLLISHKMKLHEDIQKLTDDLDHAAAQHGVLKERLNEVNAEMDTLSKQHLQALKTAESRIDNLSDQMVKSSKQHELELEKLDNELSSFRQKLRDSQGVVDELSKDNERLYGKANISEVTIENLMDERKLLQKSVMESEERNKTLHDQIIKLSADLEKTQTTLNEIAQEHSHLLYQQEKKMHRKWEDDAEVKHCKTCQNDFGVSIRKHHCRNCGAIFCDACTKYRSCTPSSKDKLRVCGPCNRELNP